MTSEEESDNPAAAEDMLPDEGEATRFDNELAQNLQKELDRKGKGVDGPSVQVEGEVFEQYDEMDLAWTQVESTPGDPLSQTAGSGFHDERDDDMDLGGHNIREGEKDVRRNVEDEHIRRNVEDEKQPDMAYEDEVPQKEEEEEAPEEKEVPAEDEEDVQDWMEFLQEEDVVEEEDVHSPDSAEFSVEVRYPSRRARMNEETVGGAIEGEPDYDFQQSGFSNISVPEIESDYAPSEGIRSTHSDSEDSDAGGFASYLSVKDINMVPVLDIGVKFANAREFRWAVNQNAIYNGFDYNIIKNDSDRITLKCKVCTWRIHASFDKNKEYIQIKTLQSEHSCERVNTNSRVTASWLGKKYVDYWRRDPGMRISTLKTKIQKELQLDVTHHVLVNARKESFRIIEGLVRDQYHRLHDYAGILLEKHPGSQIKLSPHRPIPDGPLHFQRFYIGFAEMVRGFWGGCRPFIGLDGCHLRNGKSSILISAISRDANDQMYPISYAIVEGESRETWTWFLENLLQSLGEDNHRITFMSDRQKGLVETLHTLMPNHEHRFCVRHIYQNMLKLNHGLRQGILKEHLWSIAAASTTATFKLKMDKLKADSEVAFQYLNQIPYPLWTRSAFSLNSSCDLLSNNVSECFNNWIVKARELPMLSLVDTIRRQIMARLEEKKENETKFTNNICPRIIDKVAKLKRLAIKYGRAQYAGNDLYEVIYQNSETNIEQYVVDLNARTCNCRMWQISGIPCVHAISAIINKRVEVLSYVSSYYSKEVYLRAYVVQLQPLPGPVEWPRRNFEPMEPPVWKPMPGRPKKNRRKGIDEVEGGSGQSNLRRKEKQRCTKCYGYGHNRRKCTNDPVQRSAATAIVNKGGRPPIHGRYSGQKRKRPATVNEQPPSSTAAQQVQGNTSLASQQPPSSTATQQAQGNTSLASQQPPSSTAAQQAQENTSLASQQPPSSTATQQAQGNTSLASQQPPSSTAAQQAQGNTSGASAEPRRSARTSKGGGAAAWLIRRPW